MGGIHLVVEKRKPLGGKKKKRKGVCAVKSAVPTSLSIEKGYDFREKRGKGSTPEEGKRKGGVGENASSQGTLGEKGGSSKNNWFWQKKEGCSSLCWRRKAVEGVSQRKEGAALGRNRGARRTSSS